MQKEKVVQALRDDGYLVTEWTDAPGTNYRVHAHAHREVRIVLAGEITFLIGSLERTLRPGDRIDFAPGEAHAARVGAEGVTYIAGHK